MGVVDKNGVYIYSAEDTLSTWEAFMNLGMNSVSTAIGNLRSNAVYKAANQTQANAVRDNLVANGITPSAANPILIYLTGEGKFLAWDGTAWKKNGDAVSEWNTVGTDALNTQTAASGYMLWGKAGNMSKYHIETGTAVLRAQSTGSAARDKQGWRHAYLGLKSKFTGISTALLCNGDAEAYSKVFSSDDNEWGPAVLNADGTCSKIRVLCPGAKTGALLRVNYMIVGWVQ